MSRITTLEAIPTQATTFGEPIGAPADPGSTTPALQRALNLCNNVAYNSRPFLFARQVAMTHTTTTVAATLYRWRLHIPDGVTTIRFVVLCRRSVGGNGTISLLRNGVVVATATPDDLAVAPSTVQAVSATVAAGDATYTIQFDGVGSAAGTVTLNAIWVTSATITPP